MFRILYRELIAICVLSVCALAGEYDGDFADSIILNNEATVGTVQYHLATTVLASPLQVQHSPAGGQVALGICLQNCGKTGRARILVVGQASCEFDGPVTARNFFQISPTVDGMCHDAGPSYPSHGKVGGLIVETHATAGIYPVILFSIGVQGSVGTPLVPTGNFLRDDGTWQPVTAGGLPSGLITMILSGSCPAGFTEATALNGRFLQGTLAANGDVGTTGGNATITPIGTVSQPAFTGTPATLTGTVSQPTFTGTSNQATSSVSAGTPAGTNGTVSFTPSGTISWPAGVPTAILSWPAGVPTFSGSALATHAHELPIQNVSGTVHRVLASSVFGTGTSRAAQGQITATGNTTSAAVALSQAVSAGTPAGTIAWPAGVPTAALSWPAGVPTFGGSAGTVPAETFTGSALAAHSHTLTPTGTVSQPSLTMNSYTPAGTVGQPTFSGNAVDPRPQFTKVIFCAAN